MIWKAFLKGHDFDLHELRALFWSGDTQVIKDGDEYYLASTDIDNRPAAEEFHRAAERVLAVVNGVGQANNSSFRPVALVGRFQEGDQLRQVGLAGTAESRSYAYGTLTLIDSDGKEVLPPPPPGPGRVGKAMRHPDAMEALRLMGKAEPTNWVDLFKVYEIIHAAVGGERGMISAGLATKDEFSAFRVSANRPDVSGADARHARTSGQLPRRTMRVAEARDFIGRILTTWVDSLR